MVIAKKFTRQIIHTWISGEGFQATENLLAGWLYGLPGAWDKQCLSNH